MSHTFTNGGARLLVPALVAALILAFAAGAALVARAADPVTFYGCLDDKGALSNVATSPSGPPDCKAKETAVSWSQTGPQGPQGPAGPAGPQGPAGGGGPGAPHKAIVGRVAIAGITDTAGLDIVGYQTGVRQTVVTSGGGGGGVAGKPDFADFTVVTGLDGASVKLLLATASGTHIPTVTIDIYRPGSTAPAMSYLLSDVLVTGVQDGHSGAAGDAALESLSFDYGKIEWTYTAPDGSTVKGGWDRAANKKL